MDKIIIDGMSFTLPLFIMAIGGICCERSGITNLAVEGLSGMGAFTGALAAYIVVKQLGLGYAQAHVAALLFSMAGGMLLAMVHALMCIRFKANQVVSGVVINLLSQALTIFLVKTINSTAFGRPSDQIDLEVSTRFTVPGISAIPVVGAFFRNVYPYEVFIILVSAVVWYLLYRTGFGLHLRASGDNPHALDAAGVNVSVVRFKACMLSGALCGIGGICFAYSISAQFSSDYYVGYGYLAIAALIFGNWNFMPTLAACLIFGFSRSLGYQAVQWAQLPSAWSDLIMILPYAMTLLLLVFFSKTNHAPRALGVIYDKSER